MSENKYNLPLNTQIPHPTSIYELPRYINNPLSVKDTLNPTSVLFYFPKNIHPPTDKYKRTAYPV